MKKDIYKNLAKVLAKHLVANPPKVRKNWGTLRPVTKVKPSVKQVSRAEYRAALNRYLQDNDQ